MLDYHHQTQIITNISNRYECNRKYMEQNTHFQHNSLWIGKYQAIFYCYHLQPQTFLQRNWNKHRVRDENSFTIHVNTFSSNSVAKLNNCVRR